MQKLSFYRLINVTDDFAELYVSSTMTYLQVYHIFWFLITQVSSDSSIVDLDVPFSLIFSISATMNAYSNLGVLAVITWQTLFVSIPMIYLTIRLQVRTKIRI